jgi:tyrosyl-tRNA synthetase
MFGKIMSISDGLMFRYFELLTDVSRGKLEQMQADCQKGTLHPMDLKMRLAQSVIRDFHSEEAAVRAETEFIRVFRQKEIPDEMEEIRLGKDTPLIDFLMEHRILPSRGEVKRTFGQGGIYLNNQRPESPNQILEMGKSYVLKIGKRKFFQIR